MNRYFRYFMFLVVIIQACFGVAYVLGLSFAVQLWPLPYTQSMSFIFIGSIFLAASASTLWCLLSKEDGTFAGIALDYVFIFTPVAVYAFQLAAQGRTSLISFGILCVIGAIFGLALLMWSIRIPIRDQRPMPKPVRWSFIVFIIALIIVGGQLVFKVSGIIPWSLSADSAVLYGWMFLGAAAYFSYSLFRPSWYNTAGQLAGFLAYDLVLIIPFLTYLPDVAPKWRINLIIYIAVVTYSGLLAIYYLFINAKTRVFTQSTTEPQ